MMGLFLSPMLTQQRDYVIQHASFAKSLRGLSPNDWSIVARRLVKYGFLMPKEEEETKRMRWDCHPLIREHFRAKLRRDVDAWRDAHQILFQYFEKVAEPRPDSLPGLVPLYRAVHHACLAQDYRHALQVYKNRILRDEAQGYSTNRLGAAAEDTGCLKRFLSQDSETKAALVAALGEGDVAWLWARMSFCQTCRGHLDEAVYYRRKQLEFCEDRNDLMGAASASEYLSSLYVLRGDLIDAEEAAKKAIEFAERANDWGQQMRGHSRLGTVLYFRGTMQDAARHFNEAKKLQEKMEGNKPWVIADYGFYYRLFKLDLAETQQEYDSILHDAEGASGPDENWLAPLGLDRLVKAIVFSNTGEMRKAETVFHEAIETLKESGFVVLVPYYFNNMAEFDIRRGHFDSAMENATKALQIASDYGMPLLKADSYLAVAEVQVAKRSPNEARISLERATNLANEHGYHLRKIELDLLEGEIASLEKRTEEAERIFDRVGTQIEQTGRRSLINKWEVCSSEAMKRAL